MTTPVTPPPLVKPAPWPELGAANYNQGAYVAGNSLPPAFDSLEEVAENVAENAGISHANAQAATQAAASAVGMQQVVLGAVNFKGMWQDLVGSLARPATVKHNNRFWLLLTALTDVTAAEPGVSVAWTSLDESQQVQQVVAAGTVNAVPGVVYIITGPTVTINAPTEGLQTGDTFGVRLSAAVTGQQFVNFGAIPVRGVAAGETYLDRSAFGLDLVYNASTGSWT